MHAGNDRQAGRRGRAERSFCVAPSAVSAAPWPGQSRPTALTAVICRGADQWVRPQFPWALAAQNVACGELPIDDTAALPKPRSTTAALSPLPPTSRRGPGSTLSVRSCFPVVDQDQDDDQVGEDECHDAAQADPGAKKTVAEIWGAEGKDHARAAAKAFGAAYEVKFPKAAAKISDDLDQLLAFYDYPPRPQAGHLLARQQAGTSCAPPRPCA